MAVKRRPRSLLLLTAALWLYVSGAVIAPVLMETGHPGLAASIYTLYSFACHQLPQRSFFLFGERPFYSLEDLRARVGEERLPGYPWPRAFVGDPAIGWKLALCQRDLAIYATMALVATAMLLRPRSPRPLPLWVFFLIGMGPIALDGGSQFLSYVLALLGPFHPRESTPLLRGITGALFGGTFAAAFFPRLWRAEVLLEEERSSQEASGS